MGKFETAKTVSRVIGDILAGGAGFLFGGPAGAAAAAEGADKIISSGFDIGKGIYDYFNPPEVRAKNMRKGINNLMSYAGHLKSATQNLPVVLGNKNIPLQTINKINQATLPGQTVANQAVLNPNILPVRNPNLVSRQFQYGVISPDPVIGVEIAKGPQVGRNFVSTQNINPNPAFGTSGFVKVRNRQPKEKIYKVVI